MKRSIPGLTALGVLGVAALLLRGLVAVPAAADDSFRANCFGDKPGSRLFLSGSGDPQLGQQYYLDLEWIPAAGEEHRFHALVVLAEPGHRPVLAHYTQHPDAAVEGVVDDLSPEMTTLVDNPRHTRMLARLDRGLAGAEGFSVLGVDDRGMQTELVRDARVPVGGFEIGFRFPTAASGASFLAPEYEVCCRCSSGCEECIDCVEQPPSPSCTCPGCDVSCTHD